MNFRPESRLLTAQQNGLTFAVKIYTLVTILLSTVTTPAGRDEIEQRQKPKQTGPSGARCGDRPVGPVHFNEEK